MVRSLPSTEPGASIGPYKILASLGTGGMGQVLQVQDSRNGQIRALKMRYLDRSRPRGTDYQIHREYRVLSRCNHPNIAKAFELCSEPGFVYLILEYVQGKPLDRFLDELALSPGLRRDRLMAFLALQMASALEHLHGRHLVHRDLKPGNVMVAPNEVIKLIDFGIAQDLAPSAAVDKAEHAGTYAYCSPEQLSELPTDHRSDLYSLGIVLFQMLTGRLPFEADHPLGYVVKHLTKAPTPLEAYHPSVPLPLKELIFSLLAKKPIERPQQSRQVSKTLRQFIEQFDEDRRGPWLALYRRNVDPDPGEHPLCESAFVGRVFELTQLEGALTLLAAGVGGATLVHGAVGMGKARLLEEALISARAEGFTVCVARCLPHAEHPLQILLELVEQIVVSLSGQSFELLATMLGEHLAVLKTALPSLERYLAGQPNEGTDPLPGSVEAEALLGALEAFFLRAPALPTVLVLKDLQWAEPSLLSLLSALVSAPPDPLAAPVLWLLSASTDELGSEHPLLSWLKTPPPLLEILAIRPLQEQDIGPMLRSMLGQSELSELPHDLYCQSGGNPLHIIEAVNDLLERGALCYLMGDDETTGYFSAAESADPEPLPDSLPGNLNDLLKRRLEHLSDKERTLVEAMAVLGRPCRLEWLQAITSWSPESLLEAVDNLVERRLLSERVGRRHTVYVFFHPRTLEVVRKGIDVQRLPSLYLAAADAWRQIFGDESPRSVELIADLTFEAGAYDRAVTYLLKAAEDHLQLNLYASAQRFLERALGCCARVASLDRKLETKANLYLGEVFDRLFRPEIALGYFQTALELADAHGFLELRRATILSLARSYQRQGDFRGSQKRFAACLEDCLEDCLEAGDVAQENDAMPVCLLGLAEAGLRFGNLSGLEQAIGQLLPTLPPIRNVPFRASCLYYLSRAALLQGRGSDALNMVQQALLVATAMGERQMMLRCEVLEADIRRHLGELGPARAKAGRVVESLSRHREAEVLPEALSIQAAVCLEIRDLPRAQALLERIGSELQLTPHPWQRVVFHILCGYRYLLEGHVRQSLVEALRAQEGAHEEGYLELLMRAQLLRAMGNIRQGAALEGVQLSKVVVLASEKANFATLALEASLVQSEGQVVVGRRAEATSLLETTIDGSHRLGLPLIAIRALVLRGRLAREQELLEMSVSLFRRAERLVSSILSGLAVEERPLYESRPEIKLLRHSLKHGFRES